VEDDLDAHLDNGLGEVEGTVGCRAARAPGDRDGERGIERGSREAADTVEEVCEAWLCARRKNSYVWNGPCLEVMRDVRWGMAGWVAGVPRLLWWALVLL
jgi:hypothetical protein